MKDKFFTLAIGIYAFAIVIIFIAFLVYGD